MCCPFPSFARIDAHAFSSLDDLRAQAGAGAGASPAVVGRSSDGVAGQPSRPAPGGAAAGASAADRAAAVKQNFRVLSGFTKPQLDRLRSQINAYKCMKRGSWDFPMPGRPEVTARQHMAERREATAGTRVIMSAGAAAAAAQRAGVAMYGGAANPRLATQMQPPPPRASSRRVKAKTPAASLAPPPARPLPPSVTTMPDWYRATSRPIYDLAADPVDGPADREAARRLGLNARPVPVHFDLRALVEAEADRQIAARRARRLEEVREELREVEAAASAASGSGGAGSESRAGLYQRRRRLRVEEKSLGLAALQDAVRAKLVKEQRELMEMGERPYRKLVREGEKQREMSAKEEVKRAKREKEEHFRAIKDWRRVISDAASEAKELATTRNRQVLKLHERMSKDWLRRQRDAAAVAQAALNAGAQGAQANADYLKRVEALKANDMEAYRELLAEARGREAAVGGPAEGAGADERYASLQEFLEKTEGYLEQLGGKIAALKLTQQRSEAAAAAAAEAEAAGLSEEEVLEAAERAADRAAAEGGKDLLDVAGGDGGDSKAKYYALAHTESEKIVRQPRMLTAGTLRDYQLVSLQWMISLYNNRLNGILADEMGLGKTVQVCSLIAYLWESKQNYGPHLIIVPNAVIVNWKSEIKTWLKSMQAVYYVGGREERAKIFSQQVLQLKFNVLVTTYEFIMRDRSKLSKVNWQYIIIDEAQRLKDREGRLSRDLDKFRCNRRLLLTGTPLQNDLSELWSLLNLLLPQVFDNAKVFQQWFGDDKKGNSEELDWMETEKKIIVVSRLHQILEPFMLRRLVQDVERKLPPKVTIVVHCPFSAYQAAVYDWVNTTGTIRVEPNAKIGLAARANFRGYLPLQNRCMELRKLCNHPALNYPVEKGGDWRSGEDLVRTCGKLWVLDRLLIKLRASGHRVLLFSTMTRLLDLLETYLKWRRETKAGEGMEWCRIDGSTALDEREVAITEFNAPDSKKFLFLLSIRAAGRGLNLQTADTVVVYDPDPNPKNEEQAVARSHRIGQKREVRCIHLEAVVDAIGAGDDEGGVGSSVSPPEGGAAACGLDDPTWGTGGDRKFTESIESIVRNVIQQQKIEMADEVINAGRFDQQTTHAERRETLEKLMQDQQAGNVRSCAAPSMRRLNEQLARTPQEVELFNEMDERADLWPGTLTKADETPHWIRYLAADRAEATKSNAKAKPGRAGDAEEARKAAAAEAASGVALGRGERSRGGYVPGSYKAADQALTQEDIEAGRQRAAKAAAAAAAKDANAEAEPKADADADAYAEAGAAEAGGEDDVDMLEVVEAEDSEVTHKDEELDDDAGVVDMVGAEDEDEEEEEEEDDGVRIGAPIDDDDDAPVAAAEGDASKPKLTFSFKPKAGEEDGVGEGELKRKRDD